MSRPTDREIVQRLADCVPADAPMDEGVSFVARLVENDGRCDVTTRQIKEAIIAGKKGQ